MPLYPIVAAPPCGAVDARGHRLLEEPSNPVVKDVKRLGPNRWPLSFTMKTVRKPGGRATGLISRLADTSQLQRDTGLKAELYCNADELNDIPCLPRQRARMRMHRRQLTERRGYRLRLATRRPFSWPFTTCGEMSTFMDDEVEMAAKGVKGSPASDCGMIPPRPMAKALAKITGQVPRAVAEPSGGHLPSSESAHRRVRTQIVTRAPQRKAQAICFRFGTTFRTRIRLSSLIA